MEMFLLAVAMTLLGVAVSAMAFGAATRDQVGRSVDASSSTDRAAAQDPYDGFFMEQQRPTRPEPQPIGALLLQIERHVRLEHAAAEAYQQEPTPELLHIRTASPLVH